MKMVRNYIENMDKPPATRKKYLDQIDNFSKHGDEEGYYVGLFVKKEVVMGWNGIPRAI